MTQPFAPTLHATLDTLAHLPGFDLSRGLASLRGQDEKYLTILARFLGAHTHDLAALTANLAARDARAAHRWAHTLYGSASALGAQRLAEVARDLEVLLREGRAAPLDGHAVLTSAAAVAAEYHRLVAAVPDLPPDPALMPELKGPPRMKDVRQRLGALLAQHDVDAIAYFREHEALIRAAVGPGTDALAGLIEGFEFEAAWRAMHRHAVG